MQATDVEALLKAVRRLRRGSHDPRRAPALLRPWLVYGLGFTCDEFARWVTRCIDASDLSDAFMRFYGLQGLPEDLRSVSAAVARRRRRPLARSRKPDGVTPRQVRTRFRQAFALLAVHPLAAPPSSPGAAPKAPADPFPRWSEADPRQMKVLWWAWAQVPPGEQVAPAALLHYEGEHGLRRDAPRPRYTIDARRWRRMAWSLLEVAAFRIPKIEGGDVYQVTRHLEMALSPGPACAIPSVGLPAPLISAIEPLMGSRQRIYPGDLEDAVSATRQAVRLAGAEEPPTRDAVPRPGRRRSRRGGEGAYLQVFDRAPGGGAARIAEDGGVRTVGGSSAPC
jgi:hypothetical protein